MTNETSEKPLAIESAPELRPKRKSKTKKVLLVIGVIVVVLVFWLGSLIYKGFKDIPVVEQKITEYIQLIGDGNLEVVYTNLSSERMKEAITFDKFKEAFSAFSCAYTGFKKLEFSGFHVQQASYGSFYKYSGKVTYSNGDEGSLSATLEKDSGEYKVTGIHINISPERFKAICENGA